MIATNSHRITEAPGVLVASSDEHFRRRVIRGLQTEPSLIEEACGGADALAKLEAGGCRVLLLDRRLSDLNCDDVVEIVSTRFPSIEVVSLDSQSGPQLCSPFIPPTPAGTVPRDSSAPNLPGLIGHSESMQRVSHLVRRVAARNVAVLLTGETGTGKEVVARAIHDLSPRASRQLVMVNCAAIPEALLESELFGHTRGAFTGAVQSRVGRIHAAQGGTLFLDEVGDMPMALQAKLLRFLENGEVQRLGSSDVFLVDVRVIAATNANLTLRVAERQFREDLYYRLSVFPIALPPLRDRQQDSLLIARHFLAELCGSGATFGAAAEQWILAQPWRGNVRELRHCIERASVIWDGSEPMSVSELSFCG